MPPQPAVIRFFAPVIDVTINALLATIDEKMKNGIKEFFLLISSPGGNVFHGLSAYNYLKGLPVTITTHNFGQVDSVGLVLYCAGSKRFSVPQARFLLHTVGANFKNERLEEPQLEERLKTLKIDTENIAKVIATNCGKSAQEIVEAMLARTTLNPEEAQKWGLVHEIKTQLFEIGSEVTSIQFQQQPAKFSQRREESHHARTNETD